MGCNLLERCSGPNRRMILYKPTMSQKKKHVACSDNMYNSFRDSAYTNVVAANSRLRVVTPR